jgi:predicted ATP-binding protein involved in virulence
MRNVVIKNFRCYENKSIEFRSGINLLIGDNCVGKTSLLRACNLVLNSFFSGYSDENTTWKSADNDDFRNTGIAELPVEISFNFGSWDFQKIESPSGSIIELDLDGEYKIEKKSKKNSRNLVTGLSALKEYASLLQKHSHEIVDGEIRQNHALPLYACFSTEDIHTVRKFDKNKFKKHQPKPSFGYFESYDCKGLMECWIKRLLVLKEAKIGEEEINNVRNAIIDALGPDGCNVIDDMEIRYNDGNVYFHYIDGRTAAADLLSDGYRRLINIVMDIAFRSALLNKAMYGDQSYKHTNGTVIIDEIDEHLHPALQVCILKALQMTFPKIQFIVSTHSPLVISSVETRPENIVYKLEYSDGIYSHKEINAYGLDSNLILEEKVGVLSRVPLIDSKLKLSLDYISKRKLDDAKREIDELEKLTDPNQPELVKLRAILNRIEAIGV